MRILLQFPEGLKQNARQIASQLEKEGHEVFISSAPCFGACDLALEEARMLNVDLLKHYGHAEFHKVKAEKFEIEYIPYPIDAKLDVVKRNLKLLANYKRVALIMPVQHVHQIKEISALLEKAGHTVIVEMGGSHVRHPGQVLGCDSIAGMKAAKKADCLVYFGGGLFHPFGAEVNIPYFLFDPFSGEATRIDEEIVRIQKRKRGMLIACADEKVKNFGIIVSTKNGQFNLSGAEKVKKVLESKGRSAYILVSNFIDPLALQDFNFFDAYINTACPRIPDDYERYGKPVVDISDFKKLEELL